MSWQVDVFVDERGDAPVEEYLTSLPMPHRAKALALIRMLEQEGPNLPFLTLRRCGESCGSCERNRAKTS